LQVDLSDLIRAPISENVHNWAWSLYNEVRVQITHFKIHAEGLHTIAAPTLDTMLKERYDVVWRNLPKNMPLRR